MSDDDQNWEVEEVEVSKNVGVVVSVRFPKDLASKIYELAERRGTPVSVVVREAVEEYLSAASGVPATTDITISGEGAVTLLSGRRVMGETAGVRVDFRDAPAASAH
jgi:metal-responsive CopG/Arc/MetJ family transcriptional regulator